jgi:PhoH-like ATPase
MFMAKPYNNRYNSGDAAPKTLTDHPFYGFTLDDEQIAFRDAIWNSEKLIVFCNAKAGTGKTFIATATANLLVQYGRYEGIVYISSPTQEAKLGFLPGEIEDKTAVYSEPFMEALLKLNINPYTAVNQYNITNQKNGTGYIDAITHVYLRGCNFENKVVILDETQNYYCDELKKTLTRMADSCKVIVIGHSGQIDLYHNPENSGFVRYLEHFKDDPRTAVCELNTNYRGWISSHADSLE